MNLPNALSLFRLFLTFFFILCVVYEKFHYALSLFVLQAVSDLLDGFFARRMGTKTALGAYLDPLADKVMLAGSYVVLCYWDIVPMWLVSVVLLRDVVIASGFFVLLKKGLRMGPIPSFLSKITTVCQMLTIIYVLYYKGEPGHPYYLLFWVTALLTITSGCQYVVLGWAILFRKEPEKDYLAR
jgi:cardiolipin synthase (CMP-forming)